MKKFIVSILIFLICIFSSVQAESDLKSYIDQMKEYGTELFPEIEEEDIVRGIPDNRYKMPSFTNTRFTRLENVNGGFFLHKIRRIYESNRHCT